MADVQTRGRGRRGSAWVSAHGTGVLLSVVIRGQAAQQPLSLLAGLACAEGLERLAPSLDVGLKWPNDLVVQNRKVGGILCEMTGDAVVVGIGINVSGAPDSEALDRTPGLPPAALETFADKELRRKELVGTVLAAMRRWVGNRAQRLEGDNPALTPDALSKLGQRDVLAGRLVDTDQAGRGRADGIDADGALRLITPEAGEVRIVSGGVRLSSSADPAPTARDRS